MKIKPVPSIFYSSLKSAKPVSLIANFNLHHYFSGMEISRSYTVVIPSLSSDKQDDLVTQGKVLYLMIKIYQDGALTQHIDTLKIGK